ncbi:MAG: OmpA family protein [Bacteroides sp.]|nr:OmpA family protein [Bacteroides sp.]MCM1380251.1 OmpA family protein [Bacteroides sp.]MCM1446547.1 OmpA family protein [Prevotella sp.]
MVSQTEIFAAPTAQTGQTSQTSQTSPITAAAAAVYLFPLDGSKIAEDAQLNKIAQEAKETGADVEINAYTDPSGSAAYNQKLSERRAQAVADYLAAHGVDPAHIHANGCGPTSDFATPAQDRRAEVHLM